METQTPIKVYLKTDKENRIVAINSDIFLDDITDYIEIDSGFGDKYAHAQNNYLEKPISDNGIYNYKYENGKVVERTTEEQQADYIPPEPTEQEKLRADVDFLMCMEGAI